MTRTIIPNRYRAVRSARHERAHRVAFDDIHCEDVFGGVVTVAFERKAARLVLAVQVLNSDSPLDAPIHKATSVRMARNAAQLLAELRCESLERRLALKSFHKEN